MTDTQPLNTETITATKQSMNNYKNHEALLSKTLQLSNRAKIQTEVR